MAHIVTAENPSVDEGNSLTNPLDLSNQFEDGYMPEIAGIAAVQPKGFYEDRLRDLCKAHMEGRVCDQLSFEELKICTADAVAGLGKSILCDDFYADQKLATRYTRLLFTGREDGSDGTMANTFKHAFWTLLMADSAHENGLEKYYGNLYA